MSAIHGRGACRALLAVLSFAGSAAAQDSVQHTRAEAIRALVVGSSAELAALRLAIAGAEGRLRASGFGPAAALTAEIDEIPGGLGLGRAGSVRAEIIREFRPAGLRSAQRAVAELDVRRARILAEVTEQRVRARTTALLIQALGAERLATRLAAEDTLLAGAEEALRARFAVGDARYVDVLRLRTERLRVRGDLAAVRAEGRIGRTRLLAMASDSAARQITELLGAMGSDSAMPTVQVPDFLSNLDSVAERSAGVRLAALATSGAEANRRLAGIARRPTITAALGAQRFERSSGSFVLGPVIGGSVSLPFTSRATGPAVRAADLAIAAARSNEAAERRRSLAGTRIAHERLVTALARARYAEDALLRGAREERESALAAYRSGSLSLIELIDFERAMARADSDRIRNMMEAAAALAELFAGLAESPTESREP